MSADAVDPIGGLFDEDRGIGSTGLFRRTQELLSSTTLGPRLGRERSRINAKR